MTDQNVKGSEIGITGFDSLYSSKGNNNSRDVQDCLG
jgi:hypothetical protein